MNQDDKKVIDLLKTLSIDMIYEAKSGHPGICLGASPIIYTLYARHMNINTNDTAWLNRDRFIMSAGHGSALLYACLFLAGYNITLDDLKNFRSINSKTPGHPEFGVTPGVDATTGPLGEGLATAVGMAISESHLEARYNKKKKSLMDKNAIQIFNYNTYVLCSDGDLMEGVSYEVASLAGTLKLGKLIVLYDSNNICLDGSTSKTFTENVLKRFEALGWHTQCVNNGEDVNQIDKSIIKAKMVTDKPSIIEIKTVIGKYSKNEGTNKVHGTPLSKEDITSLKTTLGVIDVPFTIQEEVVSIFRKQIYDRSNKKYTLWAEDYNEYMNDAPSMLKAEIECLMTRGLKFDVISMFKDRFAKDYKDALRSTNGDVLQTITNSMPFMIGGCADVATSTKAYVPNMGDFSSNDYSCRNIFYGVREHASGSISNGIALSGLRPYSSCFLTFSDYLKPSIRLSAMMNLPVGYIFTHDSILNGEDGPTHQPIEQLAMLRSIPNLDVFRPADANEIVGCWDLILKNTNKPSAIVISKEEVQIINTTSSFDVKFGAYIVRKETNKLDGIIIATGTEVSLAIKIANRLYETNNLDIRVISMPCMSKYKEQTDEYKNMLLPMGIKVIVMEFLSSFGWGEFVYNDKYLITLNEFGKSGKKEDILKEFKLDYMNVLNKVYELLK